MMSDNQAVRQLVFQMMSDNVRQSGGQTTSIPVLVRQSDNQTASVPAVPDAIRFFPHLLMHTLRQATSLANGMFDALTTSASTKHQPPCHRGTEKDQSIHSTGVIQGRDESQVRSKAELTVPTPRFCQSQLETSRIRR